MTANKVIELNAKGFVDHALEEYSRREISLSYWLTYSEITPIVNEHFSRGNVKAISVSTDWNSPIPFHGVEADIFYEVKVTLYAAT